MESKVCMNPLCGTETWSQSRKGWPMRSGEFVNLCDKCGSVYEQSIFCEVFHSKESGWRECTSCGKLLHCGCIASRFLIELLDSGGVNCASCARKSGLCPMSISGKANGFGFLQVDNVRELSSLAANGLLGGSITHKTNLMNLLQFQLNDPGQSLGQVKQEEVLPSVKLDLLKAHNGKDCESLTQPNLSISLGPSMKSSPVHDAVGDERGKATSILQQAARSRQLLPKPPKSVLATGTEANGGMVAQMRVARPPVEGRGKTQLLPRYWPRITDQELQQISGDSNSTIVPLFEKVLSASDAGRIGRLVLPKACAEAYFPPISQPEGLPLRIQDIKGKEWVFQFRFWPNNNSRMYVLEGVTPCIQSMQLQAGDTVTFSRMDPEGKLVMGFRKATNSATVQDAQPSGNPSVTHSTESFFSRCFENLPIMSDYSGLLQSLKGSSDTQLNMFSNNLNSAGGDINWHKLEKQEDMTKENLLLQSMLLPDKKRTRNIGPKNKRLLMDSLDAIELKLTWEEAQDLLRPSPTAKPSIVTIEDHDFEEYDEPPVFGKKSIFILRSTGEQEQWVQCDVCAKWRRLPIDALLPPKWTCADNVWDPSRSSCSAPDELSPREQETLLRLNKEYKRRRIASSEKLSQELEPSALDTLANAAITGDSNAGEPGVPTIAATTRHPRHRPGCSCIVCIQPPSGKGKHKPTCTCTVCLTVKRRFKTLMMRKRKNQTEREAEIASQRVQQTGGSRDETEVDSRSKHLSPGNEERSASLAESTKLMETGGANIDLNFHPGRGEDTRMGLSRVTMTSLLQAASFPLDRYLKQNRLTNLASEQQSSSASQLQPQATGESEGQANNEEHGVASSTQEQETGNKENHEPGPDQIQKDPL